MAKRKIKKNRKLHGLMPACVLVGAISTVMAVDAANTVRSTKRDVLVPQAKPLRRYHIDRPDDLTEIKITVRHLSDVVAPAEEELSEVKLTVRQVDEDGDPIPLPAAPGQPTVTFDSRPVSELLAEAKANLASKTGPYDTAMEDLRSIILTRPASEAKEAHELLGYAYEKAKMLEKAKREYAKWLSLYPEDDENRTRVRQRLMTLEIMVPHQDIDVSKDKTPHKGDSQTISGTVSEYAYASSTEPNGKVAQWHTDQVNSLTGVQLSASIQHDQYDFTGKLRLTELRDLSASRGNRTNLSTAYVEFADTFKDYYVRLGRQSPEAGAISRFDGVSTRFAINDNAKITFAAGVPYVGLNASSTRRFAGTAFDWNFNRELSLGAYINRETADNLLERMAIGTDLQFRDNHGALILRAEYDTVYHTWNMFTLQGTRFFGPYQLFVVYERRRSPMPYADVALGLGGLNADHQVYNSIGELLNRSGLSSSEIYTYIVGVTPLASSAVVGISKEITRDFTITSDVQVTNLSTTQAFTIAPQFDPVQIQIGQKNSYTFNFHARRENLWWKNNSTEFVVGDTIGTTRSYYVTFADSYRFGSQGRDSVSTILRYDSVNPGYGPTQTVSAILRGLHTVSEHGTIEVQYSRALSIMMVPLNSTQLNTNQTFYIGYRHDF